MPTPVARANSRRRSRASSTPLRLTPVLCEKTEKKSSCCSGWRGSERPTSSSLPSKPTVAGSVQRAIVRQRRNAASGSIEIQEAAARARVQIDQHLQRRSGRRRVVPSLELATRRSAEAVVALKRAADRRHRDLEVALLLHGTRAFAATAPLRPAARARGAARSPRRTAASALAEPRRVETACRRWPCRTSKTVQR